MHFVVLLSALVACAAGVSVNVTNPGISSRIMGGTAAQDGEIPYQVQLQSRDSHVCGGAIISENLVLTALHCVNQSQKPVDKVRAGSILNGNGGTEHNVTKYFRFDYNRQNPDIAILQVEPNFDFTQKGVRYIQLEESDVPGGTEVVVSGWGRYCAFTHWESDILLKITLQITKNLYCLLHAPQGLYNKWSICAISTGESGGGFCSGDSGGPLVGNGRLVGIVSKSVHCKQVEDLYPGVYVKVSAVSSWIKRVLSGAEKGVDF